MHDLALLLVTGEQAVPGGAEPLEEHGAHVRVDHGTEAAGEGLDAPVTAKHLGETILGAAGREHADDRPREIADDARELGIEACDLVEAVCDDDEYRVGSPDLHFLRDLAL